MWYRRLTSRKFLKVHLNSRLMRKSTYVSVTVCKRELKLLSQVVQVAVSSKRYFCCFSFIFLMARRIIDFCYHADRGCAQQLDTNCYFFFLFTQQTRTVRNHRPVTTWLRRLAPHLQSWSWPQLALCCFACAASDHCFLRGPPQLGTTRVLLPDPARSQRGQK